MKLYKTSVIISPVFDLSGAIFFTFEPVACLMPSYIPLTFPVLEVSSIEYSFAQRLASCWFIFLASCKRTRFFLIGSFCIGLELTFLLQSRVPHIKVCLIAIGIISDPPIICFHCRLVCCIAEIIPLCSCICRQVVVEVAFKRGGKVLDPFNVACVASIDLWQPFWFCIMKLFWWQSYRSQNKWMISVTISTVISSSNMYAVE